ncbi:hypothetical protein CDAR_367801 [Caerostris darwini]|uniref:Uncharacterized protein n=1 Tax=Caerostris darwini TaxID=1538125 RepID=A0AAV4T540_9ARAC|nr:hypothetical protein CDAR_367801 [Caerostris darwini]
MWEIFSHVGGLVGCWLGISVWTAINFFEDLYKSTVKLAFKMRNRSKRLASTYISPMLRQVIIITMLGGSSEIASALTRHDSFSHLDVSLSETA